MGQKHKKVFRPLNYFESVLAFVFTISGCVSISAFASLVGVSVSIVSSMIKNFTITAVIKKHKLIVQKKKKKYDKVKLLTKTKLNIIELLISKALIALHIDRG